MKDQMLFVCKKLLQKDIFRLEVFLHIMIHASLISLTMLATSNAALKCNDIMHFEKPNIRYLQKM